MLSIGSLVIYGSNGICKVTDKREEKLYGTKKEYYVLSPVSNKDAFIYVPADNEALLSKMKKLLTKAEISELVRSVGFEELKWIEDNKIRSDIFNEIINNGDRYELLKLIKCIYIKRKEMKKDNKKLRVADENTLKLAEKIINEEFSLVLEIPEDKVPDYIEKNLR